MFLDMVADDDRFHQLGPAWTDLWTRSGAGIFQSHPWVAAWWQQCRDEHELRIACAWRGTQLVGILPLCVRRYHGLRMLEWAAQPFSDYCDALISDTAAIEPLWTMINRLGGFDLYRLKNVRETAFIRPLLVRESTKEREEICLQVERRWPDGESWFRMLNKKTRNNHTRGWRILRELGVFEVRQLTQNDPTVIQHLLALKRTWEANRNSPLVRSDTMLPALVGALENLGSLRIFLLLNGETVVAGSVNAIHLDKMLALFATYDKAYERGSPGIVLMTEYTKWAFDQGLHEIDYLLGGEGYKFKFANQETQLAIFLAARTKLGSAALGAYRLIRRDNGLHPMDIGSAYRTQHGTERNVPLTVA